MHAPSAIARSLDCRRRSAQRGVAVLSVTVLLMLALLIVVAASNRNVVVDTRSSTNQYRSTQAFEAAEAGLEWALARVNDDTRLGDDCLPSSAAAATSLRDRLLTDDAALPGFRPTTWNDGGVARSQQVACRRDDAGWSCSCPIGALPTLAAAAATTHAASFVVAFAAGARPGIIVASAIGCTQIGTSCLDAADTGHDATARLEVAFALVPGLRLAPAAALTVRGDVDVGGASLGAQNRDAHSGGIAVHAGGRIAATALRLVAPAGAALDISLVSADAPLAALSPDRLFARSFGMDKAAWVAQPAVLRLACDGDCTERIASAVASGHRLIAIAGDASLRGPVVLGSAQRPIVVVATGALRLEADVALYGLLHAGSLAWQNAASGATLTGAAVSENDYAGNADADFLHDSAVLARLHSGTGTFARVGGSWKDF